MADMRQCPFGPCGRMLEVHWGTRIDSGQGVSVQKMPYHKCPPEADVYGDCPGSGMGFPLMPRDRMYLAKSEEMYVERNANRAKGQVLEGEVVEPTPDNVRKMEDKTPKYIKDATTPPPNDWFRNSDMPVPEYGNVQGGTAMSSVSELRGAIDRVHSEVSDAMAVQAVVNQRLEDAISALAATADTTSSDAAQGAMAALQQAKEKGQEVLGSTLVAQESLSVWGATL